MIECTNIKCGWYGKPWELVCSDEEFKKPVNECKFTLCPQCGGDDFEDLDEEEEA